MKAKLEPLDLEQIIEDEEADKKLQILSIWLLDSTPAVFFKTPFERPIGAWSAILNDFMTKLSVAIGTEHNIDPSDVLFFLRQSLMDEWDEKEKGLQEERPETKIDA